MPPPDKQLPPDIGSIVAATEETEADKITALKEQLETTQNALEKEKQESALLKSKVAILRDNTQIKQSAVRYAKWFMWLIPAFCLFLFIVSVTKGISVPWGQGSRSFSWEIEVGAYAQAAFVVGPIVFIATVLGFLLKGVFRQSSSDDDASLARLSQSMTRSE